MKLLLSRENCRYSIMMLLRALPTPLLRTLKKTLTRCIKLAYAQDHDSPCPSYLSKVRDLSILPRILQVDMPWWNLKLEQIANLFQQDIEDCRQTLAHDMRTIGAPAMEEVGRNEPVTSLLCGCVFFVCFCVVCFCLCFVFCVVFAFGSCVSVLVHWNVTRK